MFALYNVGVFNLAYYIYLFQVTVCTFSINDYDTVKKITTVLLHMKE